MSTEADIVERLRGSLPDYVSDVPRQIASEAAADYNDEQHNPDYYLARWFNALLLENAKLRAERDAAARDMRERCAKVADGYLAGGPIAAEIRGLSLLATSGKDAT